MKYLKTYEARRMTKEIASISDFLYDKFVGDIGHLAKTRDKVLRKMPNIYTVLLRFEFYSPMRVEYLDKVKDIANFIKPYTKRENDIKLQLGWTSEISFEIKLTKTNANKFKELEEFKQWEIENKEKHDLFILQKYVAPKYNL